MIFESVWPLVFLLAVPIVIILYLLVPKGKDTKISSNLLWEKLFKNQQSKTFWEKFIHNLLMYLQIVILLILVLALMSPYIRKEGSQSGSVVFVLDTSGSMQHTATDGTMRIEEAVLEIKNYIASAEGGTFSLLTSDGTGTNLLSVNSSDKKSLYRALEKVTCTDTDGNLKDALTAVQSLCGDEEKKKGSDVIVFTDGIGEAGAQELNELLSAEIRVMGEAGENVANTFLSCSKEGKTYTAAAGLTNYSDCDANLELSLYEGEKLIDIRRLTVKAKESYTCLFENFDWKKKPIHTVISSVTFEGSDAKDSLDEDNTAYAVWDQTASVDAVLVGDGNTYIEKAYQAVAGKSLSKAKDESSLSAEEQTIRIYDADYDKKQNDAVRKMVFADRMRSEKTVKNVSLQVSDTQLTTGISQFAVGVNETYIYDLPEWGTGFLWNGDACAGYYGEHDGIRQVVVGFDLRESDFVLQPEFPVFMANALSYLSDSSLLAQNVYEAGEEVLFHPQPDVDVHTLTLSTAKAGIYEVDAAGKQEQYVVRFATASQSDGSITAENTKGNASYQGQLVKKQLRNVLLILVLLLMILEWICYVRQQRYRGKFYLAVRVIGLFLVVLALLGVSVNKRGTADTTIFLVDISNSNEQNLEDMDDYLKQTIAKMPGKNQYGIVTFGKNSLVEQFLTKENHFSEIMSMPDKTATNLQDAVQRGLSMIPENAAGRLVILTDGKETQGNVDSTASALAARNVELLSVLYEVSQGEDAYIENVELPSYLYAGDSYSMTVTVESNYETDAALEIWKGSEKKSLSEVHLNKGTNQFVLKQKVSGENAESFEVRVAAQGDTCKENDSFRAYAVVDTLPKVLVISGMKEDSSLFSGLLKTAGCNYHVVSAINAPETLEEMLTYKSIILENVYRTDLPEAFLLNLDTYVKDYGCGLVCCGGEESYALGGYRDTELEQILPVDMQLRGVNEAPSLAMVMVIDHSGSMSSVAEGSDGATNLDLAITAADTAVDQLCDQDYVGVVTFDDQYTWQVPVTEVSDREDIHEKIQNISEGGGTTIKPALAAALKEIKKSKAELKHVVLLTDGQGETRYYDDIISEYQKAGVTLSTVAVGSESDTSLLRSLAQNCDGRYYYSDISTDIPKIFAQEVFLSGDTYLQNGTFTLAVNSGHAITKGLYEDGWPSILGYVSATPKKSSRVLIASEKDDPILTVMQYGLGHTVAWNSDVTNKWTAGLAKSDDYVQLWRRIVDYSAGSDSLGEDAVDVKTANGKTLVRYEAKDYTEQTTITAVYTDPDQKTQNVKLKASAPGVYEAELDTDETGIYNLSLQRMEAGEITNAVMTAAVVQYSDEYKFALTNDKYRAFITQYGKIIKPEENFWKKISAASRARYDLTKWLLMFAILWFVMDIAFRRLGFVPQDTKLYQAVQGCMQKRREHHGSRGKTRMQQEGTSSAADKRQEAAIKENNTLEETAGPKVENKKNRKKQEPQALDTSALLKKKDQRNL